MLWIAKVAQLPVEKEPLVRFTNAHYDVNNAKGARLDVVVENSVEQPRFLS